MVFIVWSPPTTVRGWFGLLRSNPLAALIDLDLLLVVDNVLLAVVLTARVVWAYRPAAARRTVESKPGVGGWWSGGDHDDHPLIGIVTERDVVAALADGADPATTKVADCMTDKPVTIRPEEDMQVAARRMADLGVRHLPVVDGRRLVGVLSIRDLLAPAATPAAAR